MPNTDLYVVGEGHLQKDLIELSKSLGVNGKVHWLGKTEYINDFLSKINLFILTCFFFLQYLLRKC